MEAETEEEEVGGGREEVYHLVRMRLVGKRSKWKSGKVEKKGGYENVHSQRLMEEIKSYRWMTDCDKEANSLGWSCFGHNYLFNLFTSWDRFSSRGSSSRLV